MTARRALGVLLTLFLGLCGALGVTLPAHAASDTFDRFDAAYTVRADGTTHVRETVTLRFGSGSGRHGFDRFLVTREPWDDQSDATYRITNVQVTSPDAVSTQTSTSTYSNGPREGAMRIRIGSSDRTVSAPTATYVIDYDLVGAMRSTGGIPQFYWDVTGSDMGAIRSSTVTVQVPGDVVATQCYVGPPGRSSTTPCGSQTSSGDTATFSTPDGIPSGSLLTVAVQVPQGAVTNVTPILVENGDLAQQRADEAQRANDRVMQGIGAGSAVAIPVIGWLWYRRNGHDERFVGVPPGTVPAQGETPVVGRNDPKQEVPVAFAPPKLPLTYAGYLLDGHYRTEHLTATLVGLATHGAIQLSSEGRPTATLVDASKAPDDPSRILLGELFDGAAPRDPFGAALSGRRRGAFGTSGFQARRVQPVFGTGGLAGVFGSPGERARQQPSGAVVKLDGAGQLAHASDLLAADAHDVAVSNAWFKRISRGRKSVSVAGLFWLFVIGSWFFNVSVLFSLAWVLVPATIALLITLAVVRSKMARGQRTATGRAWTDQVEGFRTYIATAEADQLRFEEGEDIFSKYLPWAVLFGLAERWVEVCQQAVQLGRLQQPDASWYGGSVWDAHYILWNLNTLGGSVGTAAAPSVAASGPSFSNDIGFGGGSAFGGGGFGGGGFAGGGGGGGGGGSW